jgi:chaperonin GroEL (HSP60 family)
MTRTSLGPNGMNKFVINQLDKVFLTKDSGVMLRELDINHPAARLIVNASNQQDMEMGDNTNFVVSLLFNKRSLLAVNCLTLPVSLLKAVFTQAKSLRVMKKPLKNV